MKRATLALPLVALCLASPVRADDDKEQKELTGVQVAEAIKPALVRVEYTLQFDAGEAPASMSSRWHRISQVIREERPLEADGYLISPTRIVTPDFMIQARFIKQIVVRFGDETVSAKPAAYATRQDAMFLDLEKPLAGTTPLTFDPKAEGPYRVVAYLQNNWAWNTRVTSLDETFVARDTGEQTIYLRADALLTTGQAVPVGMSFVNEVLADGSWKGSPADWPQLSEAEMAAQLAKTQGVATRGVLRVALGFRSPRASANNMLGMMRMGNSNDGTTEWNGVGLLLEGDRIVVLADLAPKVTARLETITVYSGDADGVECEFVGSLKDYGCFVAKLQAPLPGALALSTADIRAARCTQLFAAEVLIQGENRVDRTGRTWFQDLTLGWRRHLFPRLPAATAERENQEEVSGGVFTFSAEGSLVALPIVQREKATVRERWSTSRQKITSASNLAAALADLEKNVDASNTPLSEADENRLAWLGVELQELDQELARANNVAQLTNDGASGALVVFVYEGSPAAKVGIEVGDILLRLHVEGHPRPLEVKLENRGGFRQVFPWERLDELPEQYFDQIPSPWPSAESTFTRALTDLGFGTKYRAEYFHDGKVVEAKLEVAVAPAHFDAAKRFKSKGLGFTIAELTYEVRRYFQKAAGDPGVIVVKIEMGSKASVAGMKPYEIVTHVNEKPVHTAADFERLLAVPGELRLSVKRMHRGRILKIQRDTKEEKKGDAATKDSD